MATFRKRKGKWQVQIRRSGFRPLSKSFTLKSDAEAWARQTEADLDRPSVYKDRRQLATLTLKAILERYMREITPSKRSREHESYALKQFMASSLGQLGLEQVTPQAISDYRDKRLSEVKPASVRRELDTLSHVFEIARKQWLIPLPVNPVCVIKKPRPSDSRKRRVGTEELSRLSEVCSGLKNQNMAKLIMFALETGMRRGEITSLVWSNVSFDKRTAYLPLTKNGSSRTVPLTVRAMEILKSIEPQKTGLVFNLTNVAVRQTWERVCERAEIDDLHFHDLRHEAISKFFERGLSIPEVALISGHKDMRMLFRYTHLRAENIAEKLSEYKH